jgi:pimeloyl-ACP methyl ester carboxylesterase
MSSVKNVVLVHGGFVDGSGWEGVHAILTKRGYRVAVVQNPTNSLADDVAVTRRAIAALDGPAILVGHSYGGVVITNARGTADQVKALVYVAAVAPDDGESVMGLATKFPGSQLLEAVRPVTLPNGETDLYMREDRYHEVIAADLDEPIARAASRSQRPASRGAFTGPSGAPAWRDLPNWFIYGDSDRTLPPALSYFLARRAGSSETIVLPGGSHSIHMSQPGEVLALIERAAQTTELQIPLLDP